MTQTYKPIRLGRLDVHTRQVTYSASRIFLAHPEKGAPGRDYLIKQRNLDWETISKFGFGYMPFGIDSPFAGRIIMPIYDLYDRMAFLSARPATNDKDVLDEVGKYWNESFEKGEHLYGFNLAKYEIARSGVAILVEGQMDVSSMHSFGLYNTVGILGGALTPMHVSLLKRFCNQIVVMMDGDAAGRKHAERCEETLRMFTEKGPIGRRSETDLRFCCVFLDGETKDPDLFLWRHGAPRMRLLIAESMGAAGMTLASIRSMTLDVRKARA